MEVLPLSQRGWISQSRSPLPPAASRGPAEPSPVARGCIVSPLQDSFCCLVPAACPCAAPGRALADTCPSAGTATAEGPRGTDGQGTSPARSGPSAGAARPPARAAGRSRVSSRGAFPAVSLSAAPAPLGSSVCAVAPSSADGAGWHLSRVSSRRPARLGAAAPFGNAPRAAAPLPTALATPGSRPPRVSAQRLGKPPAARTPRVGVRGSASSRGPSCLTGELKRQLGGNVFPFNGLVWGWAGLSAMPAWHGPLVLQTSASVAVIFTPNLQDSRRGCSRSLASLGESGNVQLQKGGAG